MNLSHLRYIAEVAKTGSITKAAQNLYMGQPNLSKAIREMEKSMGTVIFKRTSKGVEPTEKGREIVERACALLRAAEDFENDFCRKNDRTEKISIGICGSEYCIGIFEDMAAKWAGENVSFEYFRCDVEGIVNQVKEGRISFGILRGMSGRDEIFPDRLGLKGQTLAEGKMLLAVGSGSSLFEKDKISFSDMTDMVQVVVSGEGMPQNKIIIGVSDAASGERVIERSSNCFMLVSSLDVSRHTSKSHKIAYKEMEPPLFLKDILIYTEGKRFSDREKEIIERCSFNQS